MLRGALNDDPGPAARHALGRLYLGQGRIAEAVAQLEATLAGGDADARLHSDLGAAYLERGKLAAAEAGGGREDFARALEQLNRALELVPSALEAHFNRALCYEHLPPPARAAEAWREYLARDPASPWAAEAREHLEALEERGPD